MPHFGLMNAKESFNSAGGALFRARLHIRGGKRRLRQGKIAAGIITLYDALIFGLRSYLMAPEHRLSRENPDLLDEREMINALREAKILDNGFDLEEFETLVEQAMSEELPDYDFKSMLSSFEALMIALEVMPFDDTSLPEEDPSTF